MAVAKGLAMNLSSGQLLLPSQAGRNHLSCSATAPCCVTSSLCILSSSVGGISIRKLGVLRSRNVSAARRKLAARAPSPVCASQETSTSTLLVQEVEFTWKGQGSEVLLTGDFLNWETKLPLKKGTNGDFSLKQKLALGKYSYKFIVDGEWKHSPDSPSVPDGTGGFNNEVIVADPTTMNGVKDFENAPKAQVPQPTNSVKAVPTPKAPKESKSDVAVEKKEASAEPRPKAAPKKVVPQSLKEIMIDNVIPLLTTALSKEAGITDLDVAFEDNQLKTSFLKGDIAYCHWVFFPDGILEGARGASLTSHGAPPSTIEPFLVDEKKITPELLVFWIKKRLFAQNILSMN
ncbi:unnamed protein product [Calypogeia fissa]